MNTERDRQMREAVQQFYDISTSMNRPLLSQSHSVNLLASEETASGWRRNGRMSSVRRFFCLFCTFDLLFTALIWLTCVMLTGASIWNVWKVEVLGYSIHTSLIDVVGVAGIRYIILLVAYAIVQCDHWCAVALTTAGTSAFLLAKVFLFDLTVSPQPVFDVFFILISFIMSWSEAWFLDCKVLPSEHHARDIMDSVNDQPIIRGNQIGIASDLNSIAEYYSPRDSPESSPILGRKIYPQLSPHDEEYKRKAGEAYETALTLLNSKKWVNCKKGPMEGDKIQSLSTDRFGKIFLLTANVDCPADFLFEELNTNIDEIPKWNPTILECKCLQKIDNQTDITYQLTSSVGGGRITSRDFVNLRRYVNKIDGTHFSASISVELLNFPPVPKATRADNKIGCLCIQPIAPREYRCSVRWIMGVDLKGWIPQYILDVAIPSNMLDFLQYMRNHVDKKRAEGAF